MILVPTVDDSEHLMETRSDCKALRQIETGVIYTDLVVDWIQGYRGGTPFSKYTYEEVEMPMEDDEPIDDSEALAIITGGEPIDS